MVKIKGWKKRPVDIRQTLRGHIPVISWWSTAYKGKYPVGIVEIYKMTSGKGKGNYLLEVWNVNHGGRPNYTFHSKISAIETAKQYMRRHPNG